LSEDLPAQLAWFRQGSVLAGYRLETQVGSGGMAVVFRALDERLSRPVALKILAPALASDGAFRRRFIAESRAAARVDDPHIIPVYEAGEADGVLFIAMRFVIGGDLRRVLEHEGALPPDRAADFISPVASALDAANGAGLVHRDVKPANILVDTRPGRPDHVYLSDFGVSKGAVSSVSLAGQFLGTPDYSAPEQIQGRVVDGRTDQYALACVAYELLTGSVPFERDQGMAVLLAHLSEPPPSLGSRRSDLPAAADQVLARALAKAPENRYGSCGDFADALREALGLAPYHPRRSAVTPDHPQTAITPQPEFPGPDGVGKAAIPADLAAAATIESVPGGGSPGTANLPATAIVTGPAHPGIRHPQAVPPMTPGVAGEDIPTVAATAKGASVADVHAADQRPPSIPDSGDRVPPTRRRRRLLAIAVAAAVLAGAAIVIPLLASSQNSTSSQSFGRLTATFTDPDAAGVDAIAFSPNSATLAAGDDDGNIYLWNTATGKLTVTLTDPHSKGVSGIAFSPNGATLATSDYDGNIYLWNAATGKLTATLTDPYPGVGDGLTAVAFSRSGATLAAGDTDGHALLYSAAGELTGTFTDPGSSGGGVSAVAFSPSGATLATADGNGHTYLWNAATGKLTATLTEPGPPGVDVSAVAFSPSGATLATADGYGSHLWNAATGKVAATLTDPSTVGVNAIAFSPSGATLATADGNGHTYLWNAASRKLTASLTEPDAVGVSAIAFSPNGTRLATIDQDGSTYLWNIS
jgi:serine/threonine protein kinase/WD40 repeat protein